MSRPKFHYQPSLLRAHRCLDEFWVITCYFNPLRYENRFKNYLTFAQALRRQNVNLLTVELAASDDAAHLTDKLCNKYVRVLAQDVLWAKERLLNVALENLPDACTQVCWADCDILFHRKNWARVCSDMLRRHRVVQPFSTAIFLGPQETPTNHAQFRPSNGFARYYHLHMGQMSMVNTDHVLKSHPGYAWAARRDVLERMQGFYDKCILGHGDIVMALAFCHNVERDGAIPDEWEPHWNPGWSDLLYNDIRRWQREASRVVDGDVAFMNGQIYHLWHGPRKNRDYEQRGRALAHFDPDEHLVLSGNMWTWSPRALDDGLAQACVAYFHKRREDDTRVR